MKRSRRAFLTSKTLRNLRLFAVPFVLTVACSGSKSSPDAPVPSLAESIDAQRSFQDLRQRWLLASESERQALEPPLRAFIARFGKDPVARVAEAYLAFLALERDDLATARALARQIEAGPSGNTRDLGLLVDGTISVRQGNPEDALDRLTPLVGKLIDPFAQTLLHEAVVEAGVDAHRWFQAIVYMNEWMRTAEEQDRAAVRRRVDKLLRRFPPQSLELALQVMRHERRNDGWDKEIRGAIAQRLARVAVARSDARLAKTVLESSRSLQSDAGGDLARLASSGASRPRIAGTTVGMVVATKEPDTRMRAAQAIAGAVEVFGPLPTDGAPEGKQGPVLIIREDGLEKDGETPYEQLANDGASLIIAGFDPEAAKAAAKFAEAQSFPVILLEAPEKLPRGARFTFVLGERDESVLQQALSAAQKAGHAHVGWLSTLEPGSENLRAACANTPGARKHNFPFLAWRDAGVSAIVIEAPPWCVRKAVHELRTLRFFPALFLGMEAASGGLGNRYSAAVATARAGRVGRATSAGNDGLAKWHRTHGRAPSWFEALGRDAAKIAHAAVSKVPASDTTDVQAVMDRRARVQRAVSEVEVPLWTTTSRGFAKKRSIPRAITFEPLRGTATAPNK